MSKQRFIDLREKGVSTWYDNISRDILSSGELKASIEKYNITGITSNPSIFRKAIDSGSSYDEQIVSLSNMDANEIFEEIASEDIRQACDLLAECYRETNGVDGYVSLEVSPELAHSAESTIESGYRLHQKLGKANAMIKVPGTEDGFKAIEQLTYLGVSVNVTLLFSVQSYIKSAQAYINGLCRRASENKDISLISSVASFFVSRVDADIDSQLPEGDKLCGKVAIANCRLAYKEYEKIYSTPEWQLLIAKGAKPQRLLWASTSTKNPEYSKTLYVDQLIAKDTVNTMPPATMDDYYNANTEIKVTIGDDSGTVDGFLEELSNKGIDFEGTLAKLQKDGVTQFLDAYKSLITSIEDKKSS